MEGNLKAAQKDFFERGGYDLDIPMTGNKWFVDTINGNDLNSGKNWKLGRALSTMAAALLKVSSNDTIVVSGVVKEHCVAPLGKFDVTIIGAANNPRQATSGGVATGGGATWLTPTVPTAATPLLELREQGWKIKNLFMLAPTDAAAIKLHRAESAVYPDASHAQILGCRFGAGFIAIEDFGGHNTIVVEDCDFEGLVGAGGGIIKVTNQGIAIPSNWRVNRNRMRPCVNGIVGAFVDSEFLYNTIWKSTTTTINLATGNVGLRNMVMFNRFNIAAVDFDPVGGVVGNATDLWYNYLADAVEQGQPAN